jgi:hypothetical protein
MKNFLKIVLGLSIISTSISSCGNKSNDYIGDLDLSDCNPNNTVDSKYCDRDGDFLADLPLSEDEWEDPETIGFSYTPVGRPIRLCKSWGKIL